MKLFKTKPALAPLPALPAPPGPPTTSAALNARLSALRERDKAVLAQILELEKKAVRRAIDNRPITRAEALELHDGGRPASIAVTPNGEEALLAKLYRERELIQLAEDSSQSLSVQLNRTEFERRWASRQADWRNATRAICFALINLEKALQNRDRLSQEIGAPAPFSLPLEGHPLLGRLGRSESQMYRYIQSAMLAGYLTAEEFNQEIEDARKAQSV